MTFDSLLFHCYNSNYIAHAIILLLTFLLCVGVVFSWRCQPCRVNWSLQVAAARTGTCQYFGTLGDALQLTLQMMEAKYG